VSDFAIETHALTRRFGEHGGGRGIDLRVRAQLLRLPRRDGAGKSTTISMLTGVLAPTGGSFAC